MNVFKNIPPEDHIVERDAEIRVGWQNLRHLDFDLYLLIISSSQALENNHLHGIKNNKVISVKHFTFQGSAKCRVNTFKLSQNFLVVSDDYRESISTKN